MNVHFKPNEPALMMRFCRRMLEALPSIVGFVFGCWILHFLGVKLWFLPPAGC
jgi:type IV secretory pathway TrbD component